MKEKNKKILIIIGTHGNEKIGIEVVDKLKKIGCDKYFDCLTANPKALAENVRFINTDLNRSYPGNKYSKFYEKRRAFSNFIIAKKYKYVIDLHEASEGKDDFIIIARGEISKKFPLQYINLNKVLLWPSSSGSMGQFLDKVIELEFGMKNKKRNKVISTAFGIIKKFIDRSESEACPSFNLKSKKIYYVYGKLFKKEFSGDIGSLTDFKKTEVRGGKFYPLLTNQYMKKGIVCYKMRLIKK